MNHYSSLLLMLLQLRAVDRDAASLDASKLRAALTALDGAHRQLAESNLAAFTDQIQKLSRSVRFPSFLSLVFKCPVKPRVLLALGKVSIFNWRQSACLALVGTICDSLVQACANAVYCSVCCGEYSNGMNTNTPCCKVRQRGSGCYAHWR